MKKLLILVCATFSVVTCFDSDENDGRPDIYQRQRQCQNTVQVCGLGLMMKYAGPRAQGIDDIVETVKKAGIRTVCKDLTAAMNCAMGAIAEPVCEPFVPPMVEKMAVRAKDVLNYMCVTRIDDLESHWACLTDDRLAGNSLACKDEIEESVEQCKPDKFMSCAEPVILSSDYCDSGSVNLVRDILSRVLSMAPNCGQHKLYRRIMRDFFLK